ncbi:MAG: hypothetical protein NW200_11185 [Hyphomonadaceae bacterium]|nr:hypothetical protein [Hyphomonadaceae bacterium]
MTNDDVRPPTQNRREQRLALGIVFGAIGAAVLASVFVALSPPVSVQREASARAVTPEAHRADLTIDVEAAVASAREAAERADIVATEAQALITRARAGLSRSPTFARLKLPDGRVYEGEASAGVPEGVGVLRGGAVAYGVGFFVGGVRSGAGADCAQPDCSGASYFGDFRTNAPTGAARVTFPDGAVYRGDVRNGAPDGFGELRRPDGSRYAGAFTMGRRDGHGVETPASGAAQSGYWSGDQLSEGLPS